MSNLSEAAASLSNAVNRLLAPDGGRIAQLVEGSVALSADQSSRLARRLAGLAEDFRVARGSAHESFPANHEEHPRWPGTDAQPGARPRLPINRKERYFTGTVLPGILSTDRFMHLDLFLSRCGLTDVETAELAHLELVTEYNLRESAWTPGERQRFNTAGLAGDTPDVIIAGEDWLVVIEAKMFHAPSRSDLAEQLEAQRPVVERLARGLGISPDRVRHVLLVPEQLATPPGSITVTWQDVLDDYTGVGNAYWCEALSRALQNYGDLVSKINNNADAKVVGRELLDLFQAGDCPWRHVGRSGGLMGAPFTKDLSTGAWESTTYQVRYDAAEPNNRNWMTVDAWAARIVDSAPQEGPPVE